ncbi:MAG: SDR family oxidoreductase [Deltaproteobacteria bacterium]|nr:MAG: SDR family oxidoreductase [Deltaproteobacteria bacterium]
MPCIGFCQHKCDQRRSSSRWNESEEYKEEAKEAHPLGLGEPNDVAFIDLFLASDESKWITGGEFNVDGGFTAQQKPLKSNTHYFLFLGGKNANKQAIHSSIHPKLCTWNQGGYAKRDRDQRC